MIVNCDYFLNKYLVGISEVYVYDDGEEYYIDSSIILHFSDNVVIQILADYDIKYLLIDDVSEIKIIGEFDIEKIVLKKVKLYDKMILSKVVNYIENPFESFYIGSSFYNYDDILFNLIFTSDEIKFDIGDKLEKILKEYDDSDDGYKITVFTPLALE